MRNDLEQMVAVSIDGGLNAEEILQIVENIIKKKKGNCFC